MVQRPARTDVVLIWTGHDGEGGGGGGEQTSHYNRVLNYIVLSNDLGE